MRPLPKSVSDSISHLAARAWDRHSPQPAAETALALREIGRMGEAAAIPRLLGFLYDTNPEIVMAAAEAIHFLAVESAPLELAQLDVIVRGVSDWPVRHRDTLDVRECSHGFTGALGIFCFNSSGYVREDAVRALAKVNDGWELSFLLIRLNDWVEPVRYTATRAVVERLVPDYAGHFVRNIALIFRLKLQGRGNDAGIFDAVTSFLLRPECRQVLRAGLTASDRDVRRLAFRMLLNAPPELDVAWLDDALNGEDTALRVSAARQLRKQLERPALRGLLDRLVSDRFAPLRREGLYGYAEKFPESAAAVLRPALLDRHVSIRETARFYLGQSGEADFAGFYREQLGRVEGDRLAPAIAGLGETGSARDASLVLRFLAGHDIRVRKAAVRAVGRLDSETYVERLLAALQDDAAGVANTARRVLEPNLYLITPQRLGSIFQGARTRHVRRLVLALIAQLAWWDRTALLIAAVGATDEAAKLIALGYIERDRGNPHRLTARPSREQLQRVEEVLERNCRHLDLATAVDIASLLSYVRREMI